MKTEYSDYLFRVINSRGTIIYQTKQHGITEEAAKWILYGLSLGYYAKAHALPYCEAFRLTEEGGEFFDNINNRPAGYMGATCS